MTIDEILREFRIETRSTAYGHHYARCPQCSDTRKPANRRSRCLGVTIDGEGVSFGCNHCGWKGGKSYANQPKTHGLARKPAHQRRNGQPLWSVYR